MEQRNLRVGLALALLGAVAVGTVAVAGKAAAAHPAITVYKTPT